MSGPPRKPDQLRARARAAPPAVGLVSLAGRRTPPPAGNWPPDIQASWATFWASPTSAMTVDADLMALRRLFDLYVQRSAFMTVGLEEPLVLGSTGQLVVNPLLKQVDVLDGKILALEDRFGGNPLFRLKLGVTFGDAHRSLADVNARIAAAAVPEPEDDAEDLRRVGP